MFAAALALGVLTPAGAIVRHDGAQLGPELLDSRAGAPGIGPTLSQGDAIMDLAREHPTVRLQWDARFGTPSSILRHDGNLSGAVAGSPEAASRAWLDRHAGLFGWQDASNLRAIKTLRQPRGGPIAVVFHQRFGALEAGDGLGGSLVVALDSANRILSVRANVVRTPRLAAVPTFDAGRALSIVSGRKAPKITGKRNEWTVFAPGEFGADHYVRKLAFPAGEEAARPAWEVLFTKSHAEGYRVVVDAASGAVLHRSSLVVFEAPEGRVFRNYPGAKGGGTHEMVSFSGDAAASPQGWFNPVSASAPALTTAGNNATTAANWFVFIAPDGPGELRPVSANGVFDLPFADAWNTSNCGSNPISAATNTADTPTYAQDALPAAVNLFYHHNMMHDFFYNLGFNEAAGNMQVNNFGKGGLQQDPLFGLVQAGALAGDIPNAELGRDNAYMRTNPDGVPNWSGMFLFEPLPGVTTPCVDGDFDAQVIYHEYAHAVSTRWVGGEYGNLSTLQGGSMGESWGDFYALHYVHRNGLEKTGAMGPYVTGDPVRGIRNFAFGDNPLTYGDIGYDLGGPEVHSDGEIWNAVLWDIRTALMKARPNGADLAAQLIADAMPISGPEPDMLDMRDAILKADVARTKGANQSILWRAFAVRGMGVSASTVDGEDVDPKPAYDSGISRENASVVLEVTDPATGAPVQGALVSFSTFSHGVATLGRTATDGTITLKLAAPNTYAIKVENSGYGSRILKVVTTAGGAVTRKVKIGVNYASTGAGAKVISSTHPSTLGAPSLALDDLEITTWRPADSGALGEESFVVDLAGDSPVAVSEVRLSARGLPGTGRSPNLRDWTIEASLDGKSFKTLTTGGFRGHYFRPLASTLGYRSWRLKTPVFASFIRFTARNAQDEEAKSIQLAELQVFGSGPALLVKPPSGVSFTHHDEGAVLVGSADLQLSRNLLRRTLAVSLFGLAEVAIPVPNPVPCTTPHATQGIDGYLFELPDGFGDGTHSFRIQFNPQPADARPDPDIYFYTSACEETGSVASAPPELENPPEIGLIPQGTKYILAQHYTTGPGTMVLDAASQKILIPKGKAAPKPKPQVKGERVLPSTGVGSAVAGGFAMLAAAAGASAWLRPRRRRS